ncbi:MAG: TetR/AcrR family transcriptional regulator [Steroidobacteraceae bacterium]
MSEKRSKPGRPAARSRGDGSRRPLGVQGARTRTRLLEAAREVFGERSYLATRVDDITKSAGMSHGAFYLYFESKAEVLEALALETAERMYRLAEELDAVEEGERGFQQLRNWIGEFFDIYQHDAPVLVAWMSARPEDERFDKLGREVMARFAGRMAKTIQRAIAHGHAHPVDPGIAATALVAMLERLSYYWFVRGATLKRADVLDTVAAIWHQAIFGRPHTVNGLEIVADASR